MTTMAMVEEGGLPATEGLSHPNGSRSPNILTGVVIELEPSIWLINGPIATEDLGPGARDQLAHL